jgi:hypothetical protein
MDVSNNGLDLNTNLLNAGVKLTSNSSFISDIDGAGFSSLKDLVECLPRYRWPCWSFSCFFFVKLGKRGKSIPPDYDFFLQCLLNSLSDFIVKWRAKIYQTQIIKQITLNMILFPRTNQPMMTVHWTARVHATSRFKFMTLAVLWLLKLMLFMWPWCHASASVLSYSEGEIWSHFSCTDCS